MNFMFRGLGGSVIRYSLLHGAAGGQYPSEFYVQGVRGVGLSY